VTYAAAVITVACFTVALDRFRVFSIARAALDAARTASRVMGDASLSDDEKERSARTASLTLFRSFGSIAWRSALAVALSILPAGLLQIANLARFSAVNDVLMSWSGLALATTTVAVLGYARSRQ